MNADTFITVILAVAIVEVAVFLLKTVARAAIHSAPTAQPHPGCGRSPANDDRR